MILYEISGGIIVTITVTVSVIISVITSFIISFIISVTISVKNLRDVTTLNLMPPLRNTTYTNTQEHGVITRKPKKQDKVCRLLGWYCAEQLFARTTTLHYIL